MENTSFPKYIEWCEFNNLHTESFLLFFLFKTEKNGEEGKIWCPEPQKTLVESTDSGKKIQIFASILIPWIMIPVFSQLD